MKDKHVKNDPLCYNLLRLLEMARADIENGKCIHLEEFTNSLKSRKDKLIADKKERGMNEVSYSFKKKDEDEVVSS